MTALRPQALSRVEVIVASLIALLLAYSAFATPPAGSAKAREKIDQAHQAGEFDGVAIIAKNGVPILAEARGLASRELSVAHTVDTRFRICSVTKQFIAVLVFQLVHDSLIGLDDSIKIHLPELPERWSSKVTIRHLLTGTSGLPTLSESFYTSEPINLVTQFPPPVSAVARALDADLQSAPGERFSYNNADAIVLGMLVAVKRSASLDDVLVQRICQPLGMHATRFATSRTIVPGLASGYSMRAGTLEREEPYFNENMGGAGALVSSAPDLARWHGALLAGTLLPTALTEIMLDGALDRGFAACLQWAYPLELTLTNGSAARADFIERNGHIAGFKAITLIDRVSGISVILLSNSDRLPQPHPWEGQGLAFSLLVDAVTATQESAREPR